MAQNTTNRFAGRLVRLVRNIFPSGRHVAATIAVETALLLLRLQVAAHLALSVAVETFILVARRIM